MIVQWTHTPVLFSILVGGFLLLRTQSQGDGFALRCALLDAHCVWEPRCPSSNVPNVRLDNFLGTGVGSSATQWMRESLRRKGFAVADETWHVHTGGQQTLSKQRYNASGGRDGMISWTARCFANEQQALALAASDQGHGHQLWSIEPLRRFRVIFHITRHPLAYLRSNLHFSQGLYQCRSLMTNATRQRSVQQVCAWDWWRLQIWEYVSIFTPELQTEWQTPFWWEPALTVSAVHWFTWK